MKLINDFYKPQYVILPIGGVQSMGVEEAAYAVNNFFEDAHTVIPMQFYYANPFPYVHDETSVFEEWW